MVNGMMQTAWPCSANIVLPNITLPRALSSDTLLTPAERAAVERLLSERLLQGFCLLERACPACATPLVKQALPPAPPPAAGGDASAIAPLDAAHSSLAAAPSLCSVDSIDRPADPVAGVAFCVQCQAHVVRAAAEADLLDRRGGGGDGSGGRPVRKRMSILVQTESGTTAGTPRQWTKAGDSVYTGPTQCAASDEDHDGATITLGASYQIEEFEVRLARTNDYDDDDDDDDDNQMSAATSEPEVNSLVISPLSGSLVSRLSRQTESGATTTTTQSKVAASVATVRTLLPATGGAPLLEPHGICTSAPSMEYRAPPPQTEAEAGADAPKTAVESALSNATQSHASQAMDNTTAVTRENWENPLPPHESTSQGQKQALWEVQQARVQKVVEAHQRRMMPNAAAPKMGRPASSSSRRAPRNVMEVEEIEVIDCNEDISLLAGTMDDNTIVPPTIDDAAAGPADGSNGQMAEGAAMIAHTLSHETAVDLAIQRSESIKKMPAVAAKIDFPMPEFTTRRAIAIKVLASKMVQGYSIKEMQCRDCGMPLVHNNSSEPVDCFVCHAIRKKHHKAKAEERAKKLAAARASKDRARLKQLAEAAAAEDAARAVGRDADGAFAAAWVATSTPAAAAVPRDASADHNDNDTRTSATVATVCVVGTDVNFRQASQSFESKVTPSTITPTTTGVDVLVPASVSKEEIIPGVAVSAAVESWTVDPLCGVTSSCAGPVVLQREELDAEAAVLLPTKISPPASPIAIDTSEPRDSPVHDIQAGDSTTRPRAAATTPASGALGDRIDANAGAANGVEDLRGPSAAASSDDSSALFVGVANKRISSASDRGDQNFASPPNDIAEPRGLTANGRVDDKSAWAKLVMKASYPASVAPNRAKEPPLVLYEVPVDVQPALEAAHAPTTDHSVSDEVYLRPGTFLSEAAEDPCLFAVMEMLEDAKEKPALVAPSDESRPVTETAIKTEAQPGLAITDRSSRQEDEAFPFKTSSMDRWDVESYPMSNGGQGCNQFASAADAPSTSELYQKKWVILRAEATSVLTRRILAGWTILSEHCAGVECSHFPLIFKGCDKRCVVCGGSGSGDDAVYRYAFAENGSQSKKEEIGGDGIPRTALKVSTAALPLREGIVDGVTSPTEASSLTELKQTFESKRDEVRKEIGIKILDGWTLLDRTCPRCVMPIMTDTSKNNGICVLCGLVGALTIEEMPSEQQDDTGASIASATYSVSKISGAADKESSPAAAPTVPTSTIFSEALHTTTGTFKANSPEAVIPEARPATVQKIQSYFKASDASESKPRVVAKLHDLRPSGAAPTIASENSMGTASKQRHGTTAKIGSKTKTASRVEVVNTKINSSAVFPDPTKSVLSTCGHPDNVKERKLTAAGTLKTILTSVLAPEKPHTTDQTPPWYSRLLDAAESNAERMSVLTAALAPERCQAIDQTPPSNSRVCDATESKADRNTILTAELALEERQAKQLTPPLNSRVCDATESTADRKTILTAELAPERRQAKDQAPPSNSRVFDATESNAIDATESNADRKAILTAALALKGRHAMQPTPPSNSRVLDATESKAVWKSILIAELAGQQAMQPTPPSSSRVRDTTASKTAKLTEQSAVTSVERAAGVVSKTRYWSVNSLSNKVGTASAHEASVKTNVFMSSSEILRSNSPGESVSAPSSGTTADTNARLKLAANTNDSKVALNKPSARETQNSFIATKILHPEKKTPGKDSRTTLSSAAALTVPKVPTVTKEKDVTLSEMNGSRHNQGHSQLNERRQEKKGVASLMPWIVRRNTSTRDSCQRDDPPASNETAFDNIIARLRLTRAGFPENSRTTERSRDRLCSPVGEKTPENEQLTVKTRQEPEADHEEPRYERALLRDPYSPGNIFSRLGDAPEEVLVSATEDDVDTVSKATSALEEIVHVHTTDTLTSENSIGAPTETIDVSDEYIPAPRHLASPPSQDSGVLRIEIPKNTGTMDNDVIQRLIEAATAEPSPHHNIKIDTTVRGYGRRNSSPGLSVAKLPTTLSSPSSYASSTPTASRSVACKSHAESNSTTSRSIGSYSQYSRNGDRNRAPSPGLSSAPIPVTYSSASSVYTSASSGTTPQSRPRVTPETTARSRSPRKPGLPTYLPGNPSRGDKVADHRLQQYSSSSISSAFSKPTTRDRIAVGDPTKWASHRQGRNSPVIDVELLRKRSGGSPWREGRDEVIIVDQPGGVKNSRQAAGVAKSGTLDALLLRIEKTKSQLAQVTDGQDGPESQYRLRGLIENLARAAEQMQQIDSS